MQSITIQNLTNKNVIPLHLGICVSFLSRLKGLMFTNSIPTDGGLFFVNSSEDRVNSAIHMFFMNIDLTIIWVDSSGVVVDKVKAFRWKTLAAPRANAKYILETHTDRFGEYNCGDILELLHDKT
jgi:uncharacterized membrane protein (UPF0127 family)